MTRNAGRSDHWLRGFTLLLTLVAACHAGDEQGEVSGGPLTEAGEYDLTNRPATEGIGRFTLRDDSELTVTRVEFAPGASEVLHTHGFDLLVVPLTEGAVDFVVGDVTLNHLAVGEIQLIPQGVPHRLGNSGDRRFDIIAIAVHR